MYAISCAVFRAAAPDPLSSKPMNPALARSEVAPDDQMPPFAVLEENVSAMPNTTRLPFASLEVARSPPVMAVQAAACEESRPMPSQEPALE